MTKKSAVEIAQNVLDMEINALKMMRDELNGDFTKAVEMILNVKGRVIISGMGKSGHVGQKWPRQWLQPEHRPFCASK